MNNQKVDVCSKALFPPVSVATESGTGEKQRAVPADVADWKRRLYSTQEARRLLTFEISDLERRDSWLAAKERVLTHRIYTALSATGGNVRDDLPGTDGTPGAAKPSTQSDCGGGFGRSLGSHFMFL